jgi:hypothetical protein
MDYFYDGQIRRYITQFMRVFIGFKYMVNGEEKHIPVKYGDMSRSVAAIINENSENKMPTVPAISCYMTGLEMDTTRLSDASFVSKVHVRERRYTDSAGTRDYQNVQGGNYTVERLMPTPFKLSMKADIWTSNTDQKLQILEQILVLFNPSLELQTTDNYLDWTSLSVLDLSSINLTSRSIPAGADSEIDICSLEFAMPVWLTPPAKVKKLGIVQAVISNVFMDSGDIVNLEELVYNRRTGAFSTTTNRYRVLLFKSNTGNLSDGQYDVTIVEPDAAILALGLDQKDYKNGEPLDWNAILEVQGGYKPGSQIYFKQSSGYDIVGTFVISPLDPSVIVVTFDKDTFPSNTDINSSIAGIQSRGTVDAIIDPYKYNPITTYNGHANIPLGIRFLMLDDVNTSAIRDDGFMKYPAGSTDSTKVPYDGPDAWKNADGSDPLIRANAIIEWNGAAWITIWNPAEGENPTYIQNIRTGIQYKWDGDQWLKSFEGEYGPGNWNFVLPS